MGGEPVDPAAQHLRLSQSGHAFEQEEIVALARCHALCLPQTASSRAGQAVLQGLYAALQRDPAAHVIWHPGEREPHLGAFAAGSAQLRDTEAAIRRALPAPLFARLALRVAMMPAHVLARRRWESVIPQRDAGYILTIGVAAAVQPEATTVRGGDVLAELESWFSGRGCRESWVDTEASNERALRFYRRMGYAEASRAYGQVLLRKTLSAVSG